MKTENMEALRALINRLLDMVDDEQLLRKIYGAINRLFCRK